MNRLRLGHGKFREHLKQIKIISSDECEYCDPALDTLDYLVLLFQRTKVITDGSIMIFRTDDYSKNHETYEFIFNFHLSCHLTDYKQN